MAHIRVQDTTTRRNGKARKRYEVIWTETVRDERGLPIPADPAKPNGRKRTRARQESFATREEAEARRDEISNQRRRPGGVRDLRGGELLFTTAADAWLASRHDLKPRTRAEYAKLLNPTTAPRKARVPQR